jgi:carboxylesterase type B
MNNYFTAVVLAGLAASLAAAVREPVKVEGGLVSGVPGKDPPIMAFKGISCAAPPVGNLRWRAPKPVTAWQGVRQADKFSASCIQNVVAERKPWTYEFMTHGDISEDCLYLNVWTGAKSASEKRPVKLYPAAIDEQAATAQNQSARDQALVAMYLRAKVRSKTATTKAYEYLWDHAMPGPDAAQFGAFHTSEVPYVLNTLYNSDRPFADADRKIADMMSSYWANFAATGDPNGNGLPVWPAFSEKPELMELGDKTEAIPLAGSNEKIKFFETFLTK